MLNGPRSRIIVEGVRAGLILILLPIALVAGAYMMGTNLPEDHTATASGLVQASPERVNELLSDYSAQENWRHGPLILVRGPVKPKLGEHCWLEGWLLTKVIFCTADDAQPTHRVVQTEASKIPFDATWTFDLVPAGLATNLTITEQTTIDPPLWRFFGQYILRSHTAATQYLRDVQAEALHHP